MLPIVWKEFANVHPFAPKNQMKVRTRTRTHTHTKAISHRHFPHANLLFSALSLSPPSLLRVTNNSSATWKRCCALSQDSRDVLCSRTPGRKVRILCGFFEFFPSLSLSLSYPLYPTPCSHLPFIASGELAGLLMIKKYHESRGQSQRKLCLIPVSAHGTNPARYCLFHSHSLSLSPFLSLSLSHTHTHTFPQLHAHKFSFSYPISSLHLLPV